MAPVQTKHSRAARSAKDARGIYAPLPSTTHAAEKAPSPSTADFHATIDPSWGRQPHEEDAFTFGDQGAFKVSKKDKRIIRHNTLLAKVEDGRVQKRKLKRRRPGKKLATDVGNLADALPAVESSGKGEDLEDSEEWEGLGDDDGDDGGLAGIDGLRRAKRRRAEMAGGGKMVMKSLRHRPGAMKRKRKMEQGEMERFGRNLAQMVGQPEGQSEPGRKQDSEIRRGMVDSNTNQADRWAALRRFIGGTMEKDKAFTAS